MTAKIIHSFINGAADILRHYGGEIRSFDGDRVMAIFVGIDKETMAVRAALAVNWLVQEYLVGKVRETWPDLTDIWTFEHSIGIDSGEALITRGGVRSDNDLISIGTAPNVAAKLSDLRDGRSLHITPAVYEPMSNEVAFAAPTITHPLSSPTQMWWPLTAIRVGGRHISPLGLGVTKHWHERLYSVQTSPRHAGNTDETDLMDGSSTMTTITRWLALGIRRSALGHRLVSDIG